ncbi:hypothetical protein [Paenibacillus cisolokensis]|uniref:hypothetical protein n=1 Tax=Paenibacillus cisolokensis TaxID=1658519 RepID=UPI001BCEFDED|nr:hypothetical protein [Paenibacillus cisolokensis]
MREELRPGALAVVAKNASTIDTFPAGSVVRIVERNFPGWEYACKSILDGEYDDVLTEDLVPITLEDARARLYAEVDRRLAQLT